MKIGTKIRQAGRCFAGCREGKTVTARKIQWTSAGNCVVCTTSGAGYGGCNKTLEREKRQIKPAREKRVVRWLSRGMAHIERVKKHARVKNRTRAFLWCVILCPLEYTLPLRLFQLFQHLEWWIKTQAVTRTFENRRWLRCFSLWRRKDRSNSWLQKLVLNLHQVNC